MKRTDLEWLLKAYLQANTGNAIRNLGRRGEILDDAMETLAKDLQIGWSRRHNGADVVWDFDNALKKRR